MNKLAEILTKNPIVIVLMFFFTVTSSIVGLVLGWNSFYKDYLSRSISVPIWFFVLLVIIIFFGWIVYATRNKRQLDPKIVTIAAKKFGVERVNASGKNFVSCSFHGTELMFDGLGSVGFESCNFNRQFFTFNGAAGTTLTMLSSMYKDQSFQPIVDSILTDIRTGELLKSTRPSTSI